MKRQTTIFKFFAKKQKDDGDLNDFCTHDSQKQNTNIEESIVTNEEKEKQNTTQHGGKHYRPGYFQASYAREFSDWIAIKRDDNNLVVEVTCNWCCSFKTQADTSSKFILGYKDSFKRESFKIHERSASHRKCEQLYKAKKNPEATPMARCMFKMNIEEKENLKKLFITAHFIAYWNKPYSDFEKQVELIRKLGIPVKEKYANRTMCTEFIHNIASSMRKKLIEDILKSPCVSLLLDGSTDISVTASVVVYMHYITEGTVAESFVGLEELPNETADGYMTALNSLSKRLELNLFDKEKTVGLATDGARTMLGSYGGVAAKLTAYIPHLVVVHCVAHRLQLAVIDSLKTVPFMQQVETTLRALYTYYHSSPKRLSQLKKTAAALEMQLLKLRDINAVRWVASKEQALQAFLQSWQVIVFHLQDSSNEDSDAPKTKGLLKTICDLKFLKYCHFLYDFLTVLRPVSVMFQRESLMLSEIKPSVNRAISLLSKLEHSPGEMETHFLSEVSSTGVFKEVQLQRVETGEMSYHKDRKIVLSGGKTSLKERFKTLDTTVAQNISIFDTMRWPEGKKLSDFGDTELEQLVEHFKVQLVNLGVSNSSFAKELLLDEWFRFKMLGKDQSLPHLCQQTMLHPDKFPVLSKLMPIVLVLPSSSASCERGFSRMNCIKTDPRARLTTANLDSLMLIGLSGASVKDFDPIESIRLWHASSGKRHTNM